LSSDSVANEQGVTLPRHIDVHVHIKTAVNRNELELLHMQITPEQVIITMADVAYTADSEGQ